MIKFFHVRNPYGKGGFTVAYQEEMNFVQYGVSYCSPKDEFVKLRGRELSAVSLFLRDANPVSQDKVRNFKKYGEVTIGREFRNISDIKYHILLDILFSEDTNKRLVKTLIQDELFMLSTKK